LKTCLKQLENSKRKFLSSKFQQGSSLLLEENQRRDEGGVLASLVEKRRKVFCEGRRGC
jgi:hypothetical protein